MPVELKNLIVWQKSHELVKKVYEVTSEFHRSEEYGLASQMKRAAISIPSNIAEGKERGSSKDYKRFLYIARGSLGELKYQLFLASDLEFIPKDEYAKIECLTVEIGKMLNTIIKKLEDRE